MSMRFFKTIFKYGIGIEILSPIVKGACTLPKVMVLHTFQLITSTMLLNPKLIHVIMATSIFITITNIVCTYSHIQVMLLPKREHLITAIFFPPFIIGCQTLNTPT